MSLTAEKLFGLVRGDGRQISGDKALRVAPRGHPRQKRTQQQGAESGASVLAPSPQPLRAFAAPHRPRPFSQNPTLDQTLVKHTSRAMEFARRVWA